MDPSRFEAVRRALPPSVTLVAVVKGRPLADAQALYDLGQRDFGENRVSALDQKAKAMPGDARWHFIGNLQSRDVKRLAGAALVHSFDRLDLAPKWPAGVPVLLQVDFTGRAERNGIAPADVAAALASCRAAGVDVRGLSTLPSADVDPRPVFRALRKLRDELGLRELSMGMSADFEVAIEEGATIVRVGRALFG